MVLAKIIIVLYIVNFCFDKKKYKKTKITKRPHTYKGYNASTYNVDILNSFNSELLLKDTESAIGNKLKDLLTKLKEFKFVIAPFIFPQKLKQLLMRLIF